MQIKTTRYHLTLVRMAFKKEISAGEGVEKKEALYTVGGNVNGCSHDGKQYGGFFKKLKIGATILSSSPTPGHISRKDKDSNLKMIHAPQCSKKPYYNSQDIETTQVPINRRMV